MASRVGLGHLLDNFEDSRRAVVCLLLGFAEFLRMDESITPRVPKGLYLCPWGALGRAPPCLA
jgi:hypothetical protein